MLAIREWLTLNATALASAAVGAAASAVPPSSFIIEPTPTDAGDLIALALADALKEGNNGTLLFADHGDDANANGDDPAMEMEMAPSTSRSSFFVVLYFYFCITVANLYTRITLFL